MSTIYRRYNAPLRPRIYLVKIPSRRAEVVVTAMTASLARNEVAKHEKLMLRDLHVFELTPTEV